MTIAWSSLILFSLLMYVVLDGYDLGIGVATLFERDSGRRRAMLELVSVAWDGNESWLVLMVVCLWAGFPTAFGTILPHAYLPLIVVLFSLIARGVSIEMVSQNGRSPSWERVFGVASLTAALAQGAALATLTSRVNVVDGAFSGSAFGSIGWYAALAAATVTCLYLALGYAFVKLKASGELRAVAGRRGTVSSLLAVALVGACLGAIDATAAPLNLTTPGRAIGFAGLLLFAVVGVVVALVALRPLSPYDALPVAGLVTATAAVGLAVVVARAPVIAPPSLTVADSASPSVTLTFLAVGVGLNIPLLLFYNWFAQRTFRGRLA